jgi:hypothetical protein
MSSQHDSMRGREVLTSELPCAVRRRPVQTLIRQMAPSPLTLRLPGPLLSSPWRAEASSPQIPHQSSFLAGSPQPPPPAACLWHTRFDAAAAAAQHDLQSAQRTLRCGPAPRPRLSCKGLAIKGACMAGERVYEYSQVRARLLEGTPGTT